MILKAPFQYFGGKSRAAHLVWQRFELSQVDALLRNGHPDVQGLARATVDWSVERRMIEEEPS